MRMRSSILFAVVCAAHAHRLHNHVENVLRTLNSVSPEAITNATTHFYNGAVQDHFLASVASTPSPNWSQRYYVDQTHWCGAGCPVFVYIGGEGPQGPPSSRLFMTTLAAEAGAMTVALEHRFFGESYPTPDMSLDNLKYLTSAQALADLARFIQYLKSAGPSDTASKPALKLQASAANSKFVTFGGSYPGNLAAWFKLKFPALTVGSVASSAPVFAEYDYDQYAQVVGSALANPGIGGSEECAAKITQGVNALQRLVKASVSSSRSLTGRAVAAIPPALKPCHTITNATQVAAYQADIFSRFQGVVQYNLQGGVSVFATCEAVVAQDDPLAALAAGVATSSAYDQRCVSTTTDLFLDTNFSGLGCGLACTSDRQWTYMSCNEFGYFQTTTGPHQPFLGFKAVDIEFAGFQTCKSNFNVSNDYSGPKANSAGLAANTEYGARALKGINITIPNGSMDPWHALGIINTTDQFFSSTQQLSAREQVVFIQDTSHCRDMFAPGTMERYGIPDTEAVQWAHAKIRANVLGYLQ